MATEAMQSAKKEARDLELALSAALSDYLQSSYHAGTTTSAAAAAFNEDLLEQGRGHSKKLEQDLQTLLDRTAHHVERMDAMGTPAGQSVAWKAQVSRLRQVLQSSNNEFKKTREKVRQREESRELLRNAKAELGGALAGAEEERLYDQEREGIHSSLRMMDENINRALTLQDTLRAQSHRIRRATAGLSNMAESIPGINTLIKAAGRKKTRDNLIVATAIAFLLCLTLWWMLNA